MKRYKKSSARAIDGFAKRRGRRKLRAMDLEKLYDVLNEATALFRKGPAVSERQDGAMKVTEVYDMPHVHDADGSLEQVDCHFLIVGVDKARAEARRSELLELLDQ